MHKIDLTETHDVMNAYQQEDYDIIRDKYTDDATKYCFDILDGKIPSGYLIKLACFRHLQDLKRSELGDEAFHFHYDMSKVQKVINFAQICPNPENDKEQVRLMSWQMFILSMLFGWRTNDDNQRRFTSAILSVARHQGKTFITAIIIVYSYLIENIGLSNQDTLITAPTFVQAHKLYQYVSLMLNKIIAKEPFKTLASTTGLTIMRNNEVVEKANENSITVQSYDSGNYDSRHYRIAVFDEAGSPSVTDNEKITRITSGMTQVSNKCFIRISTAYEDPTVPFHHDEQLLQTVMEQDFKREADRQLFLCWAQDDLAETFKTDTWLKSNPLLALPNGKERLAGLVDERDRKALEGNLYKFQNKNLNMWLKTAVNTYVKLSEIETTITKVPFDIRHRQVYIGFDYSMMSDNTALGFVFPYQDKDDKQRFYIMQHSFIPWHKAGSIRAKEKADGIDYRSLAEQGYCTITSHPQGLIDDDQVYNWLVDFVETNDLKVAFFGYDAMGVNRFIKMLEANTVWPLVAIRQRTSELSQPTKFLQQCFVEGTVSHPDDDIMTKALLNAILKEDRIGIQIDKVKSQNKIDVVDALIDAFYQAQFNDMPDKDSSPVDHMTPEEMKAWVEKELLGDD